MTMISDLDWYQLKLFLQHASAVDMDSLHVLLGVAVQFVVALALRVPVTRWTPWLAVILIEIVNEWNDLRVEQWPDAGMQYGEAAKDILLTLVLPTLILSVARLRPNLFVGHTDRPTES